MVTRVEKDVLLGLVAEIASKIEALLVEDPAGPPPPPPPPPTPTPPPPVRYGYGVKPGAALTPSGTLVLKPGDQVTGLRVTAPTGLYAVKVTDEAAGVTLRDCVIDAGPLVDQAVGYTGYSLLGCTINGGKDGAKANGRVSILGCDFTPRPTPDGAHADGIQVTGGTSIEIGFTRIVMGPGATSCILIKADQQPIDDVWLHDLYLDMVQDDRPNYALYPGGGAKGCTNVRIERVVFADRLKWSGNRASGLALYSSMRPSSGWLRDCRFADGTPIPNEAWG